MRKAGLAIAVVFLSAAAVRAGQPVDINSLPNGVRYCPAPWADNSEFMSSYFSIDARTGQLTRHDAGSGPVGMTPEPQGREEVLFVSPPISVENVYVPPPGGPVIPPRTHATGILRQGHPLPMQRRAPPPYHPQPRQQYSHMPPPPGYGARVAR